MVQLTVVLPALCALAATVLALVSRCPAFVILDRIAIELCSLCRNAQLVLRWHLGTRPFHSIAVSWRAEWSFPMGTRVKLEAWSFWYMAQGVQETRLGVRDRIIPSYHPRGKLDVFHLDLPKANCKPGLRYRLVQFTYPLLGRRSDYCRIHRV